MFNWEKGHWWESGMNLLLQPLFRVFATPERMKEGLAQMIRYLYQNGVTAYNEPGALYSPEIWALYQKMLGDPNTPFYSYFIVDGCTQVDSGLNLAQSLTDTEKQIAMAPSGKVSFFDKQIKFFADGAIISLLMLMQGGYQDGHNGEWLIQPPILEERIKFYWNRGYQLHIHVNGDLGLDQVLGMLEKQMVANPRPDHREVIVHFANSTEEQVKSIARLGAVVSANPYYTTAFSDKYREEKVGLGADRAYSMVRSGAVIKNGTSLSFHSDLPMGPSDPLYFIWAAVNRETTSKKIAAPDQRISLEQALRAVTIEAAFSWCKEHELGSIKPGKIANFTILGENVLTVDPQKIKEIPIWGRVFEGRLFPIFVAKTSAAKIAKPKVKLAP